MQNPLALVASLCALSIVSASVLGHGTAEQPVAPANLSAGNIVHRLTQLGYSDVRVISQTDEMAEVELAKAGQRYTLTVSKKLTGPATLTSTDVAQTVQRGLKTVAVPTTPETPPLKPVSPVLR